MSFKKGILLVALAAGPVLAAHGAAAQLMGNEAWNYNRGSKGFWANYQAVRKSQDAQGVGGGGSGTEVTQFYAVTNSTSIANQSVVNQTVGNNASGMVGNNLNQGSSGNQTADAGGSTHPAGAP